MHGRSRMVEGGGELYSSVARLSHSTLNHASLSRQSAFLPLDRDTVSNNLTGGALLLLRALVNRPLLTHSFRDGAK